MCQSASPKWRPNAEIAWYHDQYPQHWSTNPARVILVKTTRLVCVLLRRTQIVYLERGIPRNTRAEYMYFKPKIGQILPGALSWLLFFVCRFFPFFLLTWVLDFFNLGNQKKLTSKLYFHKLNMHCISQKKRYVTSKFGSVPDLEEAMYQNAVFVCFRLVSNLLRVSTCNLIKHAIRTLQYNLCSRFSGYGSC